MKNLNELLKDCSSKIISSVLETGGVILGEKFSGKKGYFVENIQKSDEVAAKVETETGLKGFISTDELPKYGITEDDRDKIKAEFEAGTDDVVVMVAGEKEKAEKALQIITESIQ